MGSQITGGGGGGGGLSVPQIGWESHLSPYEPELRFRIDLNLAPKGFGSEISQISCSRAGIETCLQTVTLKNKTKCVVQNFNNDDVKLEGN